MDITDIWDNSGYSPLHLAAFKNDEKIIDMLLKFVGKENPDSKKVDPISRANIKSKLKDWINVPS